MATVSCTTTKLNVMQIHGVYETKLKLGLMIKFMKVNETQLSQDEA